MKSLIGLFAILILFTYSCKKDDSMNESACPIPDPVYMPLQVGNYWVYQDVRVDTSGNEFPLGKDSLYISGDTVINGNTYSVFEGEFFPFDLPLTDPIVFILRDSSGYLVNVDGQVQFTLQNFTDTLDSGVSYNGVDTIFTWYRKMDPNMHFINLEIGSFNSYDCPTQYQLYIPSPEPNRVNHSFYSENVGIVLATYGFASMPGEVEKRLIKFHIETP